MPAQIVPLPMTSRERAALAHISAAPVIRHPQAPAGLHDFAAPDALREPEPSFTVDRRAGCVWWRLSDGRELRLVHAPQFRSLAELFAENGWRKHFLALDEAELALSDPPPPQAA